VETVQYVAGTHLKGEIFMFMAHNICVILRVIMYRIRQCKE